MNAPMHPTMIPSRAHASWVCPLAAWVSQFAFLWLQRAVPETRALSLPMLVLQFVLIVCGLYFGPKVLSQGRARVRPSSWWAAIAGTVLSVGTIVLIAYVAATSS